MKRPILKKALRVAAFVAVGLPSAALLAGVGLSVAGGVKAVRSYISFDKLYWLVRDVYHLQDGAIQALYEYMENDLGVTLAPTLEENLIMAENLLENVKTNERSGVNNVISGQLVGAGSVLGLAGGIVGYRLLSERADRLPIKNKEKEREM